VTLDERVDRYNAGHGARFPGSRLINGAGQFHGVWFLGNNYKGSGYYGAYPPGYVARVMEMFPDAECVLHLFSGSLPWSKDYVRFDLTAIADVVGDAHHLAASFVDQSFDLILADPPYSLEDASRYGTPMIDRRKVLREVAKVLVPDGYLVWLDTVWPMVAASVLRRVGVIAIFRSSNHRVRAAFVFQKPA